MLGTMRVVWVLYMRWKRPGSSASTCAISRITFSRVPISRIAGLTNWERKIGKWLPCRPQHIFAIWRRLIHSPTSDFWSTTLSALMPSDFLPSDSSSLSMAPRDA